MSSPAKRRKTNDGKSHASPVPSRSLDYFFGKQKQQQNEKKSAGSDFPLSSPVSGVSSQAQDEPALTDEQLARKLQEEWNKQDAHPNKVAPDLSEQDQSLPQTEDVQGSDGRFEESTLNAETVDNITEALTLDGVSDKDESASQDATAKQQTLALQSATAEEDTISTTIPFDQSPLTFDPSEYISQLKRQWAHEGGNATYALLTRCFFLVNSTQSRIKIVDNLVNLLRVLIEADPESLLPAVWLATNSISPPYIDLELGLGGSAISKALKKVCALDNSSLRTLFNKHGDAGDVAFEAKKRQSFTLRKPKPLSIKGVYESLIKIANSKGHGSQEVKQRIVDRLVQDARGAEESRYIVRTLVQHLRIGAVKTTMLIALSRAFLLSRPPGAEFEIKDRTKLSGLKKDALAEVWSKSEEIVKACFARRPNYDDLVPTLLQIGVCDELLIRCGLGLHVPLRPMLGNITRDLGDMLNKLHGREFSCEFKYDGQRAQVHCDDSGKVTIFSRHLEVMTEKYPDLVALVPKIRGEGVSSFILEGEVVAVDRESGDLKTFQTLANRARKDVVIHTVTIDVCLFAFDLMFLNGEELLDRPFRDRRSLLRSLFTEIPNHFTWVKSLDASSNDSETVLEFFKSALETKCEGIMVKVLDNPSVAELAELQPDDAEGLGKKPPTTPSKPGKPSKAKSGRAKKDNRSEPTDEVEGETDAVTAPVKSRRKALLATYEPDKRVDSWLKVKKDYDSAASETLDVIPIGGWHGMGRKNKWWSPILLAVRNPETGCLEAVTKCISGFTDKFYQANRDKYDPGSENVISRPSYVDYPGEPEVWFQPQEVWELSFADITLSPTYRAAIGLVSEERGLSTRFPRFLRVREDKSIEEASTSDFLAELWRKQEARAPSDVKAVDGPAEDEMEGEEE